MNMTMVAFSSNIDFIYRQTCCLGVIRVSFCSSSRLETEREHVEQDSYYESEKT